MKVLFLNRTKNFGGFSFEQLFKSIKSNLTGCEYIDFYDKTYPSFRDNLKAVKNISTDIYHITGGIGYYAMFLPSNKTILTIHDTNHYEFDLKGLRKWLFGLIFYRLPILNVKFVTVVSEHTKKNLIDFFGVNETKIKVVENCYPSSFKPSIKTELSPIPNILHIGTKPNKNLNRLINSINNLEVTLTIIGKLKPQEVNLLKEKKIQYVNKQNLSDKEIYNEYLNSDIVSFISLHEGFGLPIIEANAIGRPVITSKLSPMIEVAGKGACLVNPENESEIYEAIKKIIKDSSYRKCLVDAGFENSQRFTARNIADKYVNLYKKLIL